MAEPVYYLPFVFVMISLLLSLCFFEIRRRRLNRMLDEGYIFGVMQAGNTRIVSVIPPNQQGAIRYPQPAVINVRY